MNLKKNQRIKIWCHVSQEIEDAQIFDIEDNDIDVILINEMSRYFGRHYHTTIENVRE